MIQKLNNNRLFVTIVELPRVVDPVAIPTAATAEDHIHLTEVTMATEVVPHQDFAVLAI